MIRDRMSRRFKIVAALTAAVASAGVLSACGEQKIQVPESETVEHRGAVLFNERCSGCHTMKAAMAEGSATNVHDQERVDGPNFDQRKENVQQVLYAICNGGFSGAIMPQNIVVGADADAIAAFLAKYSGQEATNPASP